MLKIVVPKGEFYDELTEQFVYTKETTLQLEHSLVSVSKWEATWKKPFIVYDQTQQNMTQEMVMDYIKQMTVTQNVDPNVYFALTQNNLKEIIEYIQDQKTATWFGKKPQAGKRDTRPLTSERIYYFMVHYNIPFECQKWHLSRLLTLIRVCQEEEAAENKANKSSPREAALARHQAMAARRAKSAKHH